MDNKLQQKFALVQQMKKEKERKEASRGKDHRSVDIFALAGVNLPATGLAHSRQDKDKNQNSRHGSSVKGLRVQSTISPTAASTGGPLSPSSCINFVGSPGRESEEVSANEIGTTISATLGTGAGTEKKLKRSSMASRNATAASRMHVHRDTASSSEKMHIRQNSPSYIGRRRNLSVSSMGSPPYTSTLNHHISDNSHATTMTPPTPIPSPRSTRRQSSDTMTEIHNNARMHPSMDQLGSQECRKRKMDSFADFGQHSESYNGHHPRFLSNSRSRSRSPRSQGGFRSHSRSVSPESAVIYERRDSARVFEQNQYLYHQRLSTGRHQEDLPPLFTKLRVEGLADSTSAKTLLTAFEPHGQIEEAHLIEGEGTAFVTYTRMEAAQRALEMMNGSTIDGVLVRVFREDCPMYYQRGTSSEAGTLSPLPVRDGARCPSLATSTSSTSSQGQASPDAITSIPISRPIHQLPPRPRSPKLPPKPVTAVYPPAGADPRAAVSQARGCSRQILSYGDL